MKHSKNTFCYILLLFALTACNKNAITMSTDEFLKEESQTTDYNIQTSNFSYSYFGRIEAGQSFNDLVNNFSSMGSYVVLNADEEGNITYIPRADRTKSFTSKNNINIYRIGSNPNGSTRAYYDETDKIIYDALGNSLHLEEPTGNLSSTEYSILLGCDTDLFEAITGNKGLAKLALFNLTYISDANSKLVGILYKGEKDTEYLVPNTSLLSYSDKLQSLLHPISTKFTLNDDGTFETNSEIYYYNDSVVNSHVGKRSIDSELEIDTKNVEGETIFKVLFDNGASFLYSQEVITGYTNDFDYVKDNTRYKLHYYTNKETNKLYQEVDKFPMFYFNKMVMSSNGTKCAILCQEINKDKSLSYDYSTIAFNDQYKYGEFTSELGIFSGTEAYISFGENHYSYLTKEYSLYMYRQDDFAILKVKDTKLGYNYLVVNSDLQDFKIYATNISPLSTPHHFSYYTPGEKSLLQFIVLNTEDFSSKYITNNDDYQIAHMSFGLCWNKKEADPVLEDSVGNDILTDQGLLYFYETDIGADNNYAVISGKSYSFYTFYGATTYETSKESLEYRGIYCLTNQYN